MKSYNRKTVLQPKIQTPLHKLPYNSTRVSPIHSELIVSKFIYNLSIYNNRFNFLRRVLTYKSVQELQLKI